jgi:hypothetical protein
VNIAKLLRLIRWFAMVVTAASHTRLPLADCISGTEAERKNNDQSTRRSHRQFPLISSEGVARLHYSAAKRP